MGFFLFLVPRAERCDTMGRRMGVRQIDDHNSVVISLYQGSGKRVYTSREYI